VSWGRSTGARNSIHRPYLLLAEHDSILFLCSDELSRERHLQLSGGGVAVPPHSRDIQSLGRGNYMASGTSYHDLPHFLHERLKRLPVEREHIPDRLQAMRLQRVIHRVLPDALGLCFQFQK
jgi:hypothetical protein